MFDCRKWLGGWTFAGAAGVAVASLLGCSAGQLPDWQLRSSAAANRAVVAFLNAELKAFDQAFSESIFQAQRSARPEEVARLYLLRCALQVASLNFGVCPDSDSYEQRVVDGLSQSTSGSLQAYRLYVRGASMTSEQIAGLPRAQQPVAMALTSMHSGLDRVLAQVQDPLSRLVAAGVIVRAGRGSPALIAQAVETASAQGWRAPLSAWLAAQVKVARDAGDDRLAQESQRRLELLNRPSRPGGH